jgi:mono/diheme cytochrome c family protein
MKDAKHHSSRDRHHDPALGSGVGDLETASPLEYIEPGEEHRGYPLLFVCLVCAFFAWGGWYTQRYSAGYTALAYDENVSGLAGKTNAPVVIDPYVLGRRIFGDTCAKCHQMDGLGVAGQYPPLAQSEWVLAEGPARMIRIVLDAVQGPIKVKGVEYNNVMTPWRDTLTDTQIAAVITYVRTQKDWGHNASAVAPEAVTAIRKKTKDRPAIGPWTVPELLATPEHEPQP